MIYKMKIRLFFLLFMGMAQSGFGQSAPEMGCFEHFRQAGEAAANRRRPNFELARKKFSAAKECPEATGEQRRQMDERMRDVEARNLNALENQIDKAEASQALAEARAIEADSLRNDAKKALDETEKALKEAEKRRLESDAATRHANANDLAFRAQTALRDGDRTTAFRLAEFAWKFVEHGNLRARQAISDVFYQNDRTSDKCPLPWRTHNFNFDEEDTADKVQFSADGKLLAVSTLMGGVYIWELATGREVFFLPTQSVFGKAAFSADCRHVAVARQNDEVTVFNVPDGSPPLKIPLVGSLTLLNLLFSPNNEQISAVTDGGELLVFNAKTGAAISRPGNGNEHLLSTMLSNDQKTMLFISDDARIEVHNVERGERQAAFALSNQFPLAVAFSLDDKMVAVSCADRSMGIWRVADGVKLLGFAPQTLAATSLYFSNDGKMLTATYANNDAKNWDVATGMELKIDQENIGDTYYNLKVSPDGKYNAVHSYDRGLEVFDNINGKRLHARPVSEEMVEYAFSPDSRLVVSLNLDGSADFIDSENGDLRFTVPVGGENRRFQFSSDSRAIAFPRMQGSLDVWELAATPALFPERSGPLLGTALFSPDSKSVAMPLYGDSLKILDAKTGATRFLWNDRGANCLFLTADRVMTWPAENKSTCFISDINTGKLVATFKLANENTYYYFQVLDNGKLIKARNGTNGQSEIFDAATGQKVAVAPNCNNYLASPDGKFAAEQVTDQRPIHIIDRASGQVVGKIENPAQGIYLASFSPDGKKLLCIDFNENIGLVFEVPSGRLLLALRDEFLQIQTLVWSGDGKKINTGSYYFSQWDAGTGLLELGMYLPANGFTISKTGDRAVSLATPREATVSDMSNGRPLFTLRGHSKDIIEQVFSEKGDIIMTASADRTARLWDVSTGRELLRLQADTFPMASAQFSPDGKMASILQNGRPAIWHLDADTILQILGENHLFAPLSPEQIYDFNIEEPLRAEAIFARVLKGWSGGECHELARFYLEQGILQYDIGRFQTSFRRAELLFQKASNETDRPSISLEMTDLYTEWAKKLLQNRLAAEAKILAARVEKLTALAGGDDSRSKLNLAFVQSVAGKTKEANSIYQALAGDEKYREQVKYALEESDRLFGKSEESQPILAQINREIAADTIDPSREVPLENSTGGQQAEVSEITDWPEQIKLSKTELRVSLRNHLLYNWDGAMKETTGKMGTLSFYLLFDKKFDEARRFAELGLGIDSSQVFIKTNLAHAHLFSGKTEKAREIYQELMRTPDPDNLPNNFTETLLQDFELLSQAGLRSKDLPKMVELVSGQKLKPKERGKYLPQ